MKETQQRAWDLLIFSECDEVRVRAVSHCKALWGAESHSPDQTEIATKHLGGHCRHIRVNGSRGLISSNDLLHKSQLLLRGDQKGGAGGGAVWAPH